MESESRDIHVDPPVSSLVPVTVLASNFETNEAIRDPANGHRASKG